MSAAPPTYEGIVCSLSEWQQSQLPDAGIHCLTRGETIGATVSLVSTVLSLSAVTLAFALVARNYIQYLCHPPPWKWHLIEQPMDIYMLSLFASNWFQAFGMALDIKWLNEGKLQNGSYCNAQGLLEQLGETGVAMNTCAIAMHTFLAVWCNTGVYSLQLAATIVGSIWTFLILYVFIAFGVHRHADYETPTPDWCWIGSRYLREKITGEYMWFWLTLFVSVVIYILLYLLSRGNITVEPKRWWKFKFHSALKVSDGPQRGLPVMLLYPICYCIIILPTSVVRWITFIQEGRGNQNGVSDRATFAVQFVFELSGFLDVVLFFFTRRGLLLFGRRGTGEFDSRPALPSVLTDIEAATTAKEQSMSMLERPVATPTAPEARLADDDETTWDPAQLI